MHPEAREYVARTVTGRTFGRVVEFGARDINGGVRDLFDCDEYIGLDITDGPGVDEVADAGTWTSRRKFDAVVCCETLEHVDGWEALVANAIRLLKAGGLLIVTAACDPRASHSAVDGRPIVDGEFYANVDPDALRDACGGLEADVEVHAGRGDVYLTAVKP